MRNDENQNRKTVWHSYCWWLLISLCWMTQTHYLTNEKKVTDSATDPCFRGQGDFRVSTLWWSGILHILPFISHVASSSFFFAVSEHAPSESNIGSFLLWVCRVWVRILLLFTAERGGPSKNRTVERDGCPSVFRIPLLSSLALDCGYPFQLQCTYPAFGFSRWPLLFWLLFWHARWSRRVRPLKIMQISHNYDKSLKFIPKICGVFSELKS